MDVSIQVRNMILELRIFIRGVVGADAHYTLHLQIAKTYWVE